MTAGEGEPENEILQKGVLPKKVWEPLNTGQLLI